MYPRLGFEAFYTTEDMDNPVYMRDAYISDSSNYEHVIKLFEEKAEDAVCHKIHAEIVFEIHFYYKIQADCKHQE